MSRQLTGLAVSCWQVTLAFDISLASVWVNVTNRERKLLSSTTGSFQCLYWSLYGTIPPEVVARREQGTVQQIQLVLKTSLQIQLDGLHRWRDK